MTAPTPFRRRTSVELPDASPAKSIVILRHHRPGDRDQWTATCRLCTWSTLGPWFDVFRAARTHHAGHNGLAALHGPREGA